MHRGMGPGLYCLRKHAQVPPVGAGKHRKRQVWYYIDISSRSGKTEERASYHRHGVSDGLHDSLKLGASQFLMSRWPIVYSTVSSHDVASFLCPDIV